MRAEELLSHLLISPDHPLAGPIHGWASESRAFASFAATYRDKIRKKLRGARDAEGLRDLHNELEMAFLLLQEPRFTLVYEPAGQGKARGPDFSVTFKGAVTFNVEVTRMRRTARPPGNGLVQDGSDQTARERARARLQDIVCGKLQQMQAGAANALVVVMDGPQLEAADLPAALHELRMRAERSDEHVLRRGGFRGPPDFFKHYQRLSAVALRRAQEGAPSVPLGLWANNQARHALIATVQRCLGR
ncbi:MAG TPA: hypothetical protein VNL77_07515 [Roseiflexaceae bacterium]|nr:hypothetical protein [Roseiflexaceae bacterium]